MAPQSSKIFTKVSIQILKNVRACIALVYEHSYYMHHLRLEGGEMRRRGCMEGRCHYMVEGRRHYGGEGQRFIVGWCPYSARGLAVGRAWEGQSSYSREGIAL